MLPTNPVQYKNLRLGHADMSPGLFCEDKPKQEDQHVDDKSKEEVMREVEVFTVVNKDEHQRRTPDDIEEIDQHNATKGEFPFPGGGCGKAYEKPHI